MSKPSKSKNVVNTVLPLRIQAGRYYRRYDGRRVGPAERYGLSERPWYLSGEFYPDNGRLVAGYETTHDLVSEWTAEDDRRVCRFTAGDNVRRVRENGKPIPPEAPCKIIELSDVREDDPATAWLIFEQLPKRGGYADEYEFA